MFLPRISLKKALPLRSQIGDLRRIVQKTDQEIRNMTTVPYAPAIGSITYVILYTRPSEAFALKVMSSLSIHSC